VSDPSAGSPAGKPAVARPSRWLTPARIVVALGLIAIAIAAAAILSQRSQRRSGTNLTADVGYVLTLPAGQQLCEPGELIPGDTGALRLQASAGALPGPEVAFTVSDARGPLSSGVLKPGWRGGTVTIPLTRVRSTAPGTMICLVNHGARPISLGGSVPDADFYVVLNGKPLNGRMRIEYMRPGSESWFSLLPTLAHRFSLAKADAVRHWAAVAAIVLMLLAIVVALRTVLKQEARP
jgi:hypothetical protein